MLRIRPFCAIRPGPSAAARVASPPYDVVSADEARAIAAENPDSFIRVVRSEVDLPETTSPYDGSVYAKARQNLDRLLDAGLLVRDPVPRLYLYRQVREHRAQLGLVCCCHIDDYADGIIKKHENTRPDKEDDRTRHVLALNANAGPVFLTYRDDPALARLMDGEMYDRPLFHFNAPDGVTHTAWAVRDAAPFVEAFSRLPAAYVADGHHRSASAARAGAERRQANPAHTGEEEYNWFLSVLFPAGELTILPYNRVVKDLGGRDGAGLLAALRQVGDVEEADERQPRQAGRVCVYVEGRWWQLTFDPATIDRDDPIASLDVDLLQKRVLEPLLGIGDPRTDERVQFVGGVRGPGALERLVDGGQADVAFSMFATSIEQLLRVADAGLIMPPKSTWFEPKLRSGLFVHELG